MMRYSQTQVKYGSLNKAFVDGTTKIYKTNLFLSIYLFHLYIQNTGL